MRQLITTVFMTCLVLLSLTVQADDLQALRNLERERASLIETLTDPRLTQKERRDIVSSKLRRLVDLERMVMRDDRLKGNTHFLVRRAFNNFERTFLAHASVEQGKSVAGHWIDQVGLSNRAILSAERGIR